jgi:hypothetical protein
MLDVEEKYLNKRKSDRYPQEKPVLLIKPDEIGTYKDRFILNDRVWLFFYDLWQRMGDERFDAFLKNLFNSDTIDYQKFQAQILTFLPDYESRLNLWLNTTDFSSEMRIQ